MIYFFFGLLTFDIFFLNRKIKVSISFLVCKMFLVGRFFLRMYHENFRNRTDTEDIHCDADLHRGTCNIHIHTHV